MTRSKWKGRKRNGVTGMDDYIKRDEALSFPFANGHYDHKNANEHFIFGCESYKEWLEDLPIADVRENRRGEWEVVDAEEPRRYGCSICKVLVWHESNYCPRCGAIMDGVKE